MSANNLCSFFRSCYDDCVQADAVFSWRPDAGVLEAGRGQSRRKTRASWRPDAGALEARRGQSGRKTRALWRQDAGRRGVKLFLGSTVAQNRSDLHTAPKTFFDFSTLNAFLLNLIDIPGNNDNIQLSKQRYFNQRA